MLVGPGSRVLPLKETVIVFMGRDEDESSDVSPIAVIRDPVERGALSRMTFLEWLIVMIVAWA